MVKTSLTQLLFFSEISNFEAGHRGERVPRTFENEKALHSRCWHHGVIKINMVEFIINAFAKFTHHRFQNLTLTRL